jgi:hypothetical protein|tara:strand:- start:171 stop:506 length:336 start_codon:yes stop_codon:yes gene_type:complete
MDNLLLNLETEFYFITGVYLEGLSGLLFGLLFFSLAIYLIRFERKQNTVLNNIDISNEIGDEKIAKINLSRSLIEMDQSEEAKRLLGEVLDDEPNEKERVLASDMLAKISN